MNNNTLNYILENIYDFDGSTRSALMDSLTEDQLYLLFEEIGEIDEFNENFSELQELQHDAFIRLSSKISQQEKSLADLIKDFENKNSGKSIFSRQFLKDSCDHLFQSDRRKIIKAFLNSQSEDDVYFSSWQLYIRWDSFFFNDVKELWEKHHYSFFDRLIIQYFPIDYVFSNYELLDKDINYWYLYSRLYNHPDFHVDFKRLEKTNHYTNDSDINSLFFSIRTLDKKDFAAKAIDLLYKKIVQYINKYHDIVPREFEPIEWHVEETRYLSTIRIPNINNILFILSYVNASHEIIDYNIWNQKLQEDFYMSKDFDEAFSDIGKFSEIHCWKMFVGYIAFHLPEKYKEMLTF